MDREEDEVAVGTPVETGPRPASSLLFNASRQLWTTDVFVTTCLEPKIVDHRLDNLPPCVRQDPEWLMMRVLLAYLNQQSCICMTISRVCPTSKARLFGRATKREEIVRGEV
jgi:hypothetical protein